MWQRVQTLYLALAAALCAVLVFGKVAVVYGGESVQEIAYLEKTVYAILAIIPFVANLVALFSFRHRALQLRLVSFGAVLLLALQVWLAVDYFNAEEAIVFKWTAILPVIAVFLDILAIRGIVADELLVRSSSRLRSAKNRKK